MIEFAVADESQSRLWDHGWFNVTRFNVIGDIPSACDAEIILSAFVASAISQRWFCTQPDPWGASPGTHGPFLWKRMRTEWYLRLAVDAVAARVQSALDAAEFDTPPSSEQSAPVLAWATAEQAGGSVFFELRAPDALDVRVEVDVWSVFFELVSVNVHRRAMSVAVIGYD